MGLDHDAAGGANDVDLTRLGFECKFPPGVLDLDVAGDAPRYESLGYAQTGYAASLAAKLGVGDVFDIDVATKAENLGRIDLTSKDMAGFGFNQKAYPWDADIYLPTLVVDLKVADGPGYADAQFCHLDAGIGGCDHKKPFDPPELWCPALDSLARPPDLDFYLDVTIVGANCS